MKCEQREIGGETGKWCDDESVPSLDHHRMQPAQIKQNKYFIIVFEDPNNDEIINEYHIFYNVPTCDKIDWNIEDSSSNLKIVVKLLFLK